MGQRQHLICCIDLSHSDFDSFRRHNTSLLVLILAAQQTGFRQLDQFGNLSHCHLAITIPPADLHLLV